MWVSVRCISQECSMDGRGRARLLLRYEGSSTQQNLIEVHCPRCKQRNQVVIGGGV